MSTGSNREPEKVGYKQPPAEHRFKRGQSGNPKGRPRKKKEEQRQSLDFGAQRANSMLIEEAYRPVTIREGDRVEQLPAIQAVFRAMGVSAMKGNRFAQRTLAELVRGVEEADRQMRMEYLETMMTYKVEWEQAIEEAEARGLKPPTPLPHPDDIIFDLRNGTAKICGPSTKEEKERWDGLLAYLEDMQLDVSEWASQHKRARSPERKARSLEMWIFSQRFFDRINDNLPKRYRVELKDRCWERGATRPGQQKTADWLE